MRERVGQPSRQVTQSMTVGREARITGEELARPDCFSHPARADDIDR
jgi:hypothetical protein